MKHTDFVINKTLLAFLSAVAVLAFGCSKSKTYKTPDGKVTVEQKGDATKYDFKTEDGNATVMSGTKVAIPDTFPKEVPILKGAVPQMSMSQGNSEMLHLRVPGKVADVAKQYQDKLKEEGWEIESSMNMGDASMLQAKKGSLECSAMVMNDGDGTIIQLTINK